MTLLFVVKTPSIGKVSKTSMYCSPWSICDKSKVVCVMASPTKDDDIDNNNPGSTKNDGIGAKSTWFSYRNFRSDGSLTVAPTENWRHWDHISDMWLTTTHFPMHTKSNLLIQMKRCHWPLFCCYFGQHRQYQDIQVFQPNFSWHQMLWACVSHWTYQLFYAIPFVHTRVWRHRWEMLGSLHLGFGPNVAVGMLTKRWDQFSLLESILNTFPAHPAALTITSPLLVFDSWHRYTTTGAMSFGSVSKIGYYSSCIQRKQDFRTHLIHCKWNLG